MPSFGKKNCWAWKSRLEKVLICALALLSFIILVLLVFLLLPGHTKPKVCETDICLKEAAKLIQRVDPSASPCHDFYKFACGSLLKSSHGDPKMNPLNVAKEKKKHQLLEVYREAVGEEDHRMVKAAKIVFRKCTNEWEIEKDNLRTIRDVLRAVGGWPVLEGRNWDKKQFDWVNATYRLRELGYPHQIFFDINVQLYDWNSYILKVKPSSSKNNEEFKLVLSEAMEIERMVEIALIFGAPGFRNEIKADMNSTYHFYKALNKGNSNNNSGVKKMLADFHTPDVNFNWYEFIQRIVGAKVAISKEDFVLFESPDYYTQYFNLINSTPKRVLANYIMWRVVEDQIPYLTKTMRSLNRAKMAETREDFCLRILEERSLPSPIDIIRNRKLLSGRIAKHEEKIMEVMKMDFIKKLENSKEETLIVDEAKRIKIQVGDYHSYQDDKILDDLVVDMIKPRSESFLALLAQISRNFYTLTYKLLKTVPNLDISVIKGIPYYSVNTNSIIIPTIAIDVSPPAEMVPKYLDYARPVGYAFMDFLANFIDGNNSSKVSNETGLTMQNRFECFKKLVKKGSTRDGDIMAILSLIQMYGDEIAYDAYESWEKQNDDESGLIGLGYTPRQLFWVASTDCYYHIDEKESNGVFKNQQTSKYVYETSRRYNSNFAKDFGCELIHEANPLRECKFG